MQTYNWPVSDTQGYYQTLTKKALWPNAHCQKIDLKESPAFEFVVRIQDNFPHYFASSPKVTLHPQSKKISPTSFSIDKM